MTKIKAHRKRRRHDTRKLEVCDATMPPLYEIEVHNFLDAKLPPDARRSFIASLQKLASQCLPSVPDYQCLSTSSATSLNDKLVVLARDSETQDVMGFFSAVYLTIDGVGTVIHTGLICIHPTAQRSGLTVQLGTTLFMHIFQAFPDGVWITSLAEVPSSLVSIYNFATNVFPSPDLSAPSEVHLRIANDVDKRLRSTMLISPNSTFDAKKFVFRESNPIGSPFRKNVDDPLLQHRNKPMTSIVLCSATRGAMKYCRWLLRIQKRWRRCNLKGC